MQNYQNPISGLGEIGQNDSFWVKIKYVSIFCQKVKFEIFTGFFLNPSLKNVILTKFRTCIADIANVVLYSQTNPKNKLADQKLDRLHHF